MTDYTADMSRRRILLLLTIICCLALLPFLGLADFNTKGEPREAVVAFSILGQENWILPTNNGGEIPYKPPFLHWCIAAVSMLFNGGEVNEYTSRLPSALALTAMTGAIFSFFARRRDTMRALLTALVTFTAFEIYRAGMNCRVDMMLTALTVGAILMLFRWWEKGMHGVPVIPCLTAGVFMLLRGVPFIRAFMWLSLWGVLSLILPLCWYAAAYRQGGQEFLDLVMEENFGRMTGTMAYESHVNPWYYNLVTLTAGFLPWTPAALAALFIIPRSRYAALLHPRSGTWRKMRDALRRMPACTLLALTASAVIFIFYCIPASKRSVYLMPMYPFVAWFISEMLIWMSGRRPASVRVFGDILASLAMLLLTVFMAIRFGLVPDSIAGHGKSTAQTAAMLESLRTFGGARAWLFAAMSPICAVIWWARIRHRAAGAWLPLSTALLAVSLYMSLSGCYQPAVLQAKSVKNMTGEMTHLYPNMPGKVYEFLAAAENAKGNPVHFFEVNFYMGDKVRNFRREQPTEGYLLIDKGDAADYLPRFEEEGYRFTEVYTPDAGLPRHTPHLYRFTR